MEEEDEETKRPEKHERECCGRGDQRYRELKEDDRKRSSGRIKATGEAHEEQENKLTNYLSM